MAAVTGSFAASDAGKPDCMAAVEVAEILNTAAVEMPGLVADMAIGRKTVVGLDLK